MYKNTQDGVVGGGGGGDLKGGVIWFDLAKMVVSFL